MRFLAFSIGKLRLKNWLLSKSSRISRNSMAMITSLLSLTAKDFSKCLLTWYQTPSSFPTLTVLSLLESSNSSAWMLTWRTIFKFQWATTALVSERRTKRCSSRSLALSRARKLTNRALDWAWSSPRWSLRSLMESSTLSPNGKRELPSSLLSKLMTTRMKSSSLRV